MHTLSLPGTAHRRRARTVLLACLAMAPLTAQDAPERVDFALPDANGQTVRPEDFPARHLFLVFHGIP